MRKRGQKIKLRHVNTGEVIKATVVLADSKQGYLAELIDKPYCGFLDAWHWYHPKQLEEVK